MSEGNDKPSALTTGQVGKYCGVNFRTVIRWIEKGKIEAYKLPGGRGDYRITVENFINFLKKNDIPIPADLQTIVPTVLLVDDDENITLSIERLLKGLNLKVITANNGFNAGIMLKEHDPQLVVLDIYMPGIDGLAVLKSIKTSNKKIKVIILTGAGDEEVETAKKEGADHIFKKPFEPEEFINVIKKMIFL